MKEILGLLNQLNCLHKKNIELESKNAFLMEEQVNSSLLLKQLEQENNLQKHINRSLSEQVTQLRSDVFSCSVEIQNFLKNQEALQHSNMLLLESNNNLLSLYSSLACKLANLDISEHISPSDHENERSNTSPSSIVGVYEECNVSPDAAGTYDARTRDLRSAATDITNFERPSSYITGVDLSAGSAKPQHHDLSHNSSQSVALMTNSTQEGIQDYASVPSGILFNVQTRNCVRESDYSSARFCLGYK